MPVQLYLRDVTSVDQSGQNLLSRLAAKGIDLVASGVYTSYLVQALTGAAKGPRNPDIDKTAPSGRKRGPNERVL